MTDTIHNFSSDGTKIARGRSLIANGGTIVTGLTEASGFVGKCESSDTVAAATSISGGTVTVSLKAAGSNATGNHYVAWEAWDNKKI